MTSDAPWGKNDPTRHLQIALCGGERDTLQRCIVPTIESLFAKSGPPKKHHVQTRCVMKKKKTFYNHLLFRFNQLCMTIKADLWNIDLNKLILTVCNANLCVLFGIKMYKHLKTLKVVYFTPFHVVDGGNDGHYSQNLVETWCCSRLYDHHTRLWWHHHRAVTFLTKVGTEKGMSTLTMQTSQN